MKFMTKTLWVGSVMALLATSSFGTSVKAEAATKDIVDTAVAAGSFKTLAAALQAAGLVETLKGKGPFTVFAPTDAAFAKLPAGTLDALLKNPVGLAAILKYHVVAGRVMAADVIKGNGAKPPQKGKAESAKVEAPACDAGACAACPVAESGS